LCKLEIVEIRVEYLCKYLQARQMALLIEHIRCGVERLPISRQWSIDGKNRWPKSISFKSSSAPGERTGPTRNGGWLSFALADARSLTADVYADFQLRCSGLKWVVLWQSMSFIVELPDSVAEALRLAPPDAEAEVRKELALALYARGILGFGKARELCGLTKWQFEELLGRRKVIRPYDEDDLAVDLAYARRSQ
jgi:predicted HTH domain antitoxin